VEVDEADYAFGSIRHTGYGLDQPPVDRKSLSPGGDELVDVTAG